jgi:hypothetical protein
MSSRWPHLPWLSACAKEAKTETLNAIKRGTIKPEKFLPYYRQNKYAVF